MGKQLAARVTSLDKSKIEDGYKNIEVHELCGSWCLGSLHDWACCLQPCMHRPSSTSHLDFGFQVQKIDVPEPKEGQALIKMTLR